MAMKANPIWGFPKTSHFHLGLPHFMPKRCGFGLELRVLNKWECCSMGVLAQIHRAITPVEGEKPHTFNVASSEATERSQDSQSSGFHKDLNLLPKPLSAMELSSSPDDGILHTGAYQVHIARLRLGKHIPIVRLFRVISLKLHSRLHIVGEVQLVINHCLLGLPGVPKEELKRVLSHPQNINWMDHMKRTEFDKVASDYVLVI